MENNFGLGSLAVALLGGMFLGKLLGRKEIAWDRDAVASELERMVVGLRSRAQTQADHRELDDVLKGIEDLRAGRVPFESRESFTDKVKATLGGIGRRLNPFGSRDGVVKAPATAAA